MMEAFVIKSVPIDYTVHYVCKLYVNRASDKQTNVSRHDRNINYIKNNCLNWLMQIAAGDLDLCQDRAAPLRCLQ